MKEISKNIINLIKKHGSALVIDKANMVYNYKLIESLLLDCEMSWVVKNNAYGLGLETILPIAQELNCKHIFVATLCEGIKVRELYKDAIIYILHGVLPEQEQELYSNNLIPVLGSILQVQRWIDFAKIINKKLPGVIHVETGINRLAIAKEDAIKISESSDLKNHIDVIMILSHFACADVKGHYSVEDQYNTFMEIIKYYPNTKYSLSASSGIFIDKKYHFDMVRPAIAFYGSNVITDNLLKPVVGLYSSILQVKNIKKGEFIGYSYKFEAKRDSQIAVISSGYAEGILRQASFNNAYVVIDKYKAPIVGTISMDLITIDITDIPKEYHKEGAIVELIGSNIAIDEVAKMSETVPAEILSNITKRYPKVIL